jgi:Arc/MetJ-type ribon-helix-helix transcriptional regulator
MKKPISATIDKELISWIEKEIQDKKKYRNKSHLIEIALEFLKKEGEKEKKERKKTSKNSK